MKIPTPRTNDFLAAIEIITILNSLSKGIQPAMHPECGVFDIENHDHCKTVIASLLDSNSQGSIASIVHGMKYLCDSSLNIVDQQSEVLQLSKNMVAALAISGDDEIISLPLDDMSELETSEVVPDFSNSELALTEDQKELQVLVPIYNFSFTPDAGLVFIDPVTELRFSIVRSIDGGEPQAINDGVILYVSSHELNKTVHYSDFTLVQAMEFVSQEDGRYLLCNELLASLPENDDVDPSYINAMLALKSRLPERYQQGLIKN